jgi:hypothetical protein
MTSTIKVNTVTTESGSTLTIGGCGKTVALAAGASQTGFGRSGSVDWQTTPKTTTFTAANGEGYFINSGSAITANLPAGSAGAIVAFSDYARNFATYPFIIAPNGSEKIGGVAETLQLDVNGQAITLVYVDSTKGWVNVQNAEDTEVGTAAAFIAATGGTVSTVCTNFKVHTFTGPGTFCVSCAGNAKGSNKVSYLVVAGGGEGGSTSPSNGGGGGGAGGFREGKNPDGGYTASPIASTCGLAVSVQPYSITVGAGGAQQPNPSNNLGNSGAVSTFSTITSAGGGGAKYDGSANPAAQNGGSGGGGAATSVPNQPTRSTGGSGNTPPTNPAQGNDGGTGGPNADGTHGGGGGGGAGGVGRNVNPGTAAGTGGVGATTNITGSPVAYAGGGGAAATAGGAPARGAASPCGTGGQGGSSPNLDGSAGTINRGGGGGGGGWPAAGTARGGGGSGIVVIRYKFQ